MKVPRKPSRQACAAVAVLLGALAAGIAASSCAAERRAPRAPTQGLPVLKVMTYNLNYGLAGDESTLEAIEHEDPDLVLLQETTAEWELAIRKHFATRYSHMAFRHCCLAGGLGVLSKSAFEELAYIEPPPGGWFPALHLRVQSPLGALQVMNVHLRPQIGDSGPNVGGVVSGQFTTPPIRRDEISRYLGYLEPGTPALIAGDFNESEDGGALNRLEGRGFKSALPQFNDDDTWRWTTSVGKVSRRFDHIVYGPELDVLSAKVVGAGNSDHLPVIAVIERK
jgi:endonuclease/exonuclease/phosphatase (EEP) superfamily protein YafD